jgi:hypothetical protein
MWTEQFQSMLVLMVMAALLRISYEMSRPKCTPEVTAFADTRLTKEIAKPGTITSHQKEWADKAVKRYAEAQEKKWRNWSETMFEPAK